jgi:hypothetical protein
MKVIVVLIAVAQAGILQAQVPGYEDLYDPFQVRNLNFEMDPGDWSAVKNDAGYTIVKPAYFWADDESKIIVSIKRKPNAAIGDKVALKIDINEYFDNLRWHGVKKLSLENGYDADAVTEGLAWFLHRQAAGTGPAGYKPPLAAWVNVSVNGQRLGMYANVEQIDKTFLRNRDQWVSGETWLYKQGEVGPSELKSGDGDSPILQTLNYSPFVSGGASPPADYITQFDNLIDMEQMLTVGAIEAFIGNYDGMLTKGKNFFFADYAPGAGPENGRRLYLPWDLDAVLGGSGTTSIYDSKGQKFDAYRQYITDVPYYRTQYNQIMLDLLNGSMSVQAYSDFLDQLELVLRDSIMADPDGKIGDVAGHFDSLLSWYSNRHANVLQQLADDMAAAAPTPTPEPSSIAILTIAALATLKKRRRASH